METIDWNQITPLPFDDQGWLEESNKEILQGFFKRFSIKTVIELGSWKGRSALFFASLLPEDGKVYCVDTWQGYTATYKDKSFENYTEDKPLLFQQFLSNVVTKKQTDKIIPVRMTTKQAAVHLDIKADLIYIDASHDEKSVMEDIMNYAPKLSENGVLCGDDYRRFQGVTDATHQAAIILRKKLRLHPPLWWMEEF